MLLDLDYIVHLVMSSKGSYNSLQLLGQWPKAHLLRTLAIIIWYNYHLQNHHDSPFNVGKFNSIKCIQNNILRILKTTVENALLSESNHYLTQDL